MEKMGKIDGFLFTKTKLYGIMIKKVRNDFQRRNAYVNSSMSALRLCAFADEASPDRSGQIKALQENAIPYIEVRGVDGVNIAGLSREAALQFKSELDAAGIRVWSIGSPAGKSQITEDFSRVLAQFEHLLDMAEIFEAQRIRLFSFYGTNGDDACFEEVCRRLNAYCDLCEARGVIPCHENEKGIYGDIASRCLRLHKAVPRLKAVFDPANFIQCGQDVMEAWDMLSPYVEYSHIKDAAPDGHIVPPGEGIGQLSTYLPLFAARGCTVLTLEPHLAEFVGLSSLEGDVERSEVGGFSFKSNREAFDYAASALKHIIGMQ